MFFSDKSGELESYFENDNLALIIDYPFKVFIIYVPPGHINDLSDKPYIWARPNVRDFSRRSLFSRSYVLIAVVFFYTIQGRTKKKKLNERGTTFDSEETQA